MSPPFSNLPGLFIALLFIAKPRANSSWTASLETWKLVSQSARRVGGPYAAHLTAGAADIDPPHVLSVAEGSLDDPHGLQQLTFPDLIDPPLLPFQRKKRGSCLQFPGEWKLCARRGRIIRRPLLICSPRFSSGKRSIDSRA